MFFEQKKVVKILGCMSLAIFANPSVYAAQPAQDRSGWSASVHISNLQIDSKVAKAQAVGDSTFVLGAAGERYFSGSNNTLSLGLDILFYDDQAGFSNETTGGTKESSASGGMFFAEYGPKIHFGESRRNFVDVRGGYSISLGGSRSISYCDGCDSEDIDIAGGAYGILGIGHSFSKVEIGLQYQQYFSGDLDSSLRLKLATSF